MASDEHLRVSEGGSGRSPYFCYRCGHVWMSKSDSEPKRCPRCHSCRWDVPSEREAVCRFCGLKYRMSSSRDPCPGCGRTQTDGVAGRTLRCNQCDYVWTRRGSEDPKRCPMCHSGEWNLPKVEMHMCQQCGHLWRKRTEHPERCPKCKSRVWDRPQRMVRCQRCGYVWRVRDTGGGEPAICPSCRSTRWNRPMLVSRDVSGDTVTYRKVSRPGSHLIRCSCCGTRWYSRSDGDRVCPCCGSRAGMHERFESSSMTIWAGDGYEMTYLVENGCGYVYLWRGDVPLATNHIHEMLRGLGIRMNDLIDRVNAGSMEEELRGWAMHMYDDRDACLEETGYLMKRLSLSEQDARILAVHFTGMNPDAISLRLSVPMEEVDAAFVRIMSACDGSGLFADGGLLWEGHAERL